jgi:pimeloyl-ACP methyl ester carboxylesterase
MPNRAKRKRSSMGKVTSKDGTIIAFDRSGHGPPFVLVGSAFATKRDEASVAAALAPYFTVYAYDRRGRGESGDRMPYAVEREVEDIAAMIDEAGESAFVFGHSSGAVLALEAARLLPAGITKLALYEPPFIIDDSRSPMPEDFASHLAELVSSGHRDQTVEYWMTQLGTPAEAIAQMRQSSIWSGLEALAPTLAYDATIMGDTQAGSPSPLKKWASVTIPTLVMDGGESPAFMHNGAQAIAQILPNAQLRTLEGQGHGPADSVLVPILVEFFRS